MNMKRTKQPTKVSNRLKYSVYREFELDFTKELKRLRRGFKGAQLARQLKLIKLFQAGEFAKLEKAYNQLPYSKSSGCSEKEYVGTWLWLYAETIKRKFYHFGEMLEADKLELVLPLKKP